MDDPSVDISLLTRQEVLFELGINSSKSIVRLQAKLRKQITENHPIKTFLNGMGREETHQLYRKIATKATIVHLDRMKKFIADKFFNKFGKAP